MSRNIIGFAVGDVRYLCEPRARDFAARILRDVRSPSCRNLDADYEFRMGKFCSMPLPSSLPPYMRAAFRYAQWRIGAHYGVADIVLARMPD
jgi:hypothetical protein